MRFTRVLVFSAAVAVAIGTAGSSHAQPGAQRDRSVTVMTRNLYLGADIDPILFAGDFFEVIDGVTQAWIDVNATDFNARVIGLADEIEDTDPDIIGLQEAVIWRVQEQGDLLAGGTVPATEVAYDFLAILLDELSERKLRYDVAVSQELMDVELPTWFGQDVRLTDRDVILVRKGKRRGGSGPVHVIDTDRGVFDTLLAFPAGGPGGPLIVVERGWLAVDAKVRGQEFRFVNTHLEDDPVPQVQVAQALELLAGPLVSDDPVICLGDFNSDAIGGSTPTYSVMLAAGFHDTWTYSGGATWGHDPLLRNPLPTLAERLDFVFYDRGFSVDFVDVVGDEVQDITPSGLWPSDHAGVVATLTFD